MIKHYTDHAANERTFLAWVRTAIAVMAFGFLIERFDIFLATMASGAQSHPLLLHGQKFANEVGLAFIMLGIAMIVVAAIRFFRIAKEIDKDEAVPSSGSLFDLALAALLLLLGLSLFLYLARAVLPSL
jgi:putative membrane protein